MTEPRSGRVASWGASSGSRVSLARSSLPRSRPWSAAAAHGRWASILTCYASLMCEINHGPTQSVKAINNNIKLNETLSMSLLRVSMLRAIANR